MRQILRHMWTNIRADIRWVRHVLRHYQKLLWVSALAVLVVALCFAIAPSMGRESALRIAGMCYQIIGFGIVVWGLLDIARVIDQPPLLRQAVAHIRQTPRRRQAATATLSGDATFTLNATAKLRITPPKDSTLEQRLEVVERNLSSLDSAHDATVRSLDENIRLIQKDIATERGEREKSVATVSGKLEGATAGNLGLELAGVAFFVVGVVMASVSHEIDGLLSG